MIYNNHTYYNCKITLDSGESYFVDANWIHNQQLDNWNGWECHAGVDRIYIDSKLNVYDGECVNRKLGNIQTGWDILHTTSICNQIRCTGCTDDLIVYKRKKNEY